MKRIHQGALRVGRGLLARTEMTPARYDLMQAMAVTAPCWGRVARRQSELWKALGVSRATVSKMLQRMEKHGLIVRRVDPHDRRQRWVELTRKGAANLRLSRRLAMAPIAAHVEHALPTCGYLWKAPPETLLVPFEDPAPPLAKALRRARRRLRDRATLRYLLFPRSAALGADGASPRVRPASYVPLW